MKLRDAEFHYINLASRPDRREHAEAEFARLGITAHRFEAFTPDQWRGTAHKVAKMQAGQPGGTPGAIGCYMSQTAIIRSVVDSDRIVGVCEDDICFCDDMQERLEYIENHLPADWDIFYLGATFHAPGVWCHHEDCEDWGAVGKDVMPTPDPRIMRTFGIWSTYGYLVNGKSARKVLDLFDQNLHRARGIDHLAIILGPKIKSYCFVPGCCWQYDGKSNIREGGFTEFSNFKALGPWAWTDRMEDFDAANFDWNNFDPKRWDGEKGIYNDA